MSSTSFPSDMAKDKTSTRMEVQCYMTDFNYHLKASAFMDAAQDLSTKGSAELGFGHERMAAEDLAWVLYRMQFRFFRPIRWKEMLTLNTWHKGVEGILFLRDYELLDDTGACVLSGTSSWAVLNTRSRLLVRGDDLPEYISPVPQCTDSMSDTLPPKVVFPKHLERKFVREHVVRYSDIDINGHTNNVKYVVWAMDSIDQDFVMSEMVKEVSVNFNRETRLGDRVELYAADDTADGHRVFYVDGMVEGRQSFAVRLLF